MNQIYEDKGSFNFIYQLPQTIYSTLLSIIINTLIKYFSLSEQNVLKIKEEKRKTKSIDEKLKKLYKILKIKFAVFFIITPVFLLLF